MDINRLISHGLDSHSSAHIHSLRDFLATLNQSQELLTISQPVDFAP